MLELEYQLYNATDIKITQIRREKIHSNLKALGKNIKPYLGAFNDGLSGTSTNREFQESTKN